VQYTAPSPNSLYVWCSCGAPAPPVVCYQGAPPSPPPPLQPVAACAPDGYM